ncbi:MAG: YdcF family protein [Chloroflexota bacterium]|nr:YdcF family protein [Chloroflexota bacterium]MDQ6905719.1 YdcF family protein [Chloroflexota bacterium]
MARSAPPYSHRAATRTRPRPRPRPLPATRRSGRARRRTTAPLFRVFGVLMLVLLSFTVVAALTLGVLIKRQAGRDEARPADAIVVLGAAQWDGKPSPVLQARLDHAFDLYAAGLAPKVIVTGGVGTGDNYSEGEVARQYLLRKGVPTAAVLTENRGRSSYESMEGATLLMQHNGWRRALLVSDPFHMYRLKRMATDLGVSAATSPTRTSPIRPGSDEERRYMLREVATLADYLLFRH